MPYCSQCGSDVTGCQFCAQCGARVAAAGPGASIGPQDQFDAQSDNPYLVGAQSQVVGRRFGDSDAPEVPGFGRALRICLVEKYLSFKGRASRSEYWFYILWLFLLWLVVSIASLGLFFLHWSLTVVLAVGFFVYIFFPTTSVTVRRFHDVGLSGWIVFGFYACHFILGAAHVALWVNIVIYLIENEAALMTGDGSPDNFLLFSALGLANSALQLAFLIVACWPGTQGPNKYGPAPWKRPNA